MTVKWMVRELIFAGIDLTMKVFVAKKSVFNVNPKLCNQKEIDDDYLTTNSKFKIALRS